GGKLAVIRLAKDYDGAAPVIPAAPLPDALTNPRLNTTDIELAAALLACGIPLWRDLPLRRSAGEIIFYFQPMSPCGQFQTAPLMLAWQDKEWHREHPEHPFAYVSCAIEN